MKITGLRIWIAGLIVAIGTAGLTGCGKKTQTPLSKSSFLLNTFVTVTLYDTEDEKILDGCLDLCAYYEGLLSKTIETSEIYMLNHRKKGQRVFTVSEETAQVLEKGLEYSRLSEGAFDITIEPVSALWNFGGMDSHVPDKEEIQRQLEYVDYTNVAVSGNQVIFSDDETSIDLGAIAKGFIADKMKEYLAEQGVKSAIINLGGNVLCLGSRPDGSPFKIGLRKPFASENDTVEALEISDMSVVSSGVYERYFEEDGVLYHHLLDTDTGYPLDNGLWQVSIISEYSVDGDGLSTACFSLGLEKGMELIESLDGVYAVFLTEDGTLHYTKGARELSDH